MRDKRERWKGMEPIAESGFKENSWVDTRPENDSPTNARSLAKDLTSVDMTPMVDVTFLLLIFFMITASFVMVRSVEHPLTKTDTPTDKIDEKDQQPFIECIVDQHGSFHIVCPQSPPIEAAGILEMREVLRSAIEAHAPERLVITTHEESALKRMIAVYSTGRMLGMASIELKTTEIDY